MCSTSGEIRADIARYVCIITMLINTKKITRKEGGEEGNIRMYSSYSTVTDFAKFRGKSTFKPRITAI